MKIRDVLTEQGVVEAIDIGQEWMTDTELDQYVPDQLQQQWRELVGYDAKGNVSALWANITGGYEPDANDPEDRANMVRVANKWFAMKRIPNVRFYDVRDVGDELEWLVQIGAQGVAEAVDPGRRRILAGILGLAAQGVVPQSVASALTRELAAPADSGDVLPRAALKLLAAIRSRLGQFEGDQRFDREMANIAGKLGMSVDQFDEFMDFYEYGSDPEQAAQQLVQHLRSVDPRSISVTDRDFDDDDDDDDDDDQVSGTDLSQAINTATSAAGRGQVAAVAGAAADQFRSLVQRVMSAGQTRSPSVRDMGRIEPTSSAPALPAPDRAAADIMAQLRDVVGRDLTDQEQEVVRQEVSGNS